MAMLTDSLAVDIGIAILTVSSMVILYLNETYKYWKKRGVPFVKPYLFFGNFKDNMFGKCTITESQAKIYNELKGERFGGFFELHVPNLMIKDPDLIYKILVKDFAHFHDRGIFNADPESDPLTNTITGLTGERWRTLRHKLSPTFSSGKLKGMLDQIYNCGETVLTELNKSESTGEPLEGRDIMSLFTIDVVASCAFGLQFKVNTPEGEPFKEMVKKSFPQSKLQVAIFVFRSVYTRFSKMIGLKSFPKDVTEYFLNLSKETVRYRKQNGVQRNDFLQLLINLKDTEDNQIHLAEEDDTEEDSIVNQLKYSTVYKNQLGNAKVMTDSCLAASSFIFLVAGTEVATVLNFALYCLATNPEVQQRLQQEVDKVIVKHGGLNYQAVKDMVYMDQVLQESMRLYPTGGFLSRVCTIPYHIPGTDVVIEEGTRITIPVWSIHRDPQYYQDPEKFIPDRFCDNNYKPSPTFMPFGDGPRICIAMRFAILEMKVCLARVLSQYSVHLNKKTLHPIKLDPRSFIIRPLGGIWINVARRKSK